MDLLHPDFRIIVDRFISLCVQARIAIVIVETWRSKESHEEDIRNGRSWIATSKHQHTIVKKLNDKILEIPASLAIDICPYDEYRLHGDDKLEWDSNDPIWQRLGQIGKALGLKWGGDWFVKDMGHFEWSITL